MSYDLNIVDSFLWGHGNNKSWRYIQEGKKNDFFFNGWFVAVCITTTYETIQIFDTLWYVLQQDASHTILQDLNSQTLYLPLTMMIFTFVMKWRFESRMHVQTRALYYGAAT